MSERMDPNNQPPIIGECAGSEPRLVSRWRWWLHLALLGVLPLIIGVMGYIGRNRTVALLPPDVPGLLRVCFFEMGFFLLVFAVAWLVSRANAQQMLLPWRGGCMPLLLGFAGSFALRIAVMVLLVPIVLVWFLLSGGNPAQLQHLRPGTEQLLDASALVRSPLYLVLCLTLLSFIVAGLREELWRAGMFAGFQALFPRRFATLTGKIISVAAAALLFGSGHTVQGWMGVCATTLLGAGLGAIMLWRRSIWEAVIAHGFFDASSFLMLYLLTKYHFGPL